MPLVVSVPSVSGPVEQNDEAKKLLRDLKKGDMLSLEKVVTLSQSVGLFVKKGKDGSVKQLDSPTHETCCSGCKKSHNISNHKVFDSKNGAVIFYGQCAKCGERSNRYSQKKSAENKALEANAREEERNGNYQQAVELRNQKSFAKSNAKAKEKLESVKNESRSYVYDSVGPNSLIDRNKLKEWIWTFVDCKAKNIRDSGWTSRQARLFVLLLLKNGSVSGDEVKKFIKGVVSEKTAAEDLLEDLVPMRGEGRCFNEVCARLTDRVFNEKALPYFADGQVTVLTSKAVNLGFNNTVYKSRLHWIKSVSKLFQDVEDKTFEFKLSSEVLLNPFWGYAASTHTQLVGKAELARVLLTGLNSLRDFPVRIEDINVRI
ncbi:hypothetical protein HDU76_004719 [Blyttiomyces sp. JEL0837]|nr:hypothetical protein HDU76_004719 [Blyttiomyces sp. JEL0837]